MRIIELDHITFSYAPDEPPVLRDLSLTVEAGECLVLQGDNGSGKTTLFRVLNGLSLPQAGVYRFDGEAVTASLLKNQRWAKRFHKRVGYLFQNPDVMLFNASVREEIAFGEIARRVERAMDRLAGLKADCIEDIMEADARARAVVRGS